MGLGGCIILVAVGAILTFATDWKLDTVNVDLVGVIMMLVGVIGIAAYVSIFKRRRMTGIVEQPVVEERRYPH